jgi:hypothetical protein
MKKTIALLLSVACLTTYGGEPPKPVEKWSCEGLDTPEAVLYAAGCNTLFVSNIAGKPSGKDGVGFISKVSPDGMLMELKWAEGLDAPKGMAIHGNRLYASNIDELVAIDLETGKIKERYPAEDAGFLNDVAADASGNIYVSDSSPDGSAIYRLADGKLDLWLRDPAIIRPNGLHMLPDRLLVGNAKQGGLHAVVLKTRKVVPVAQAKTGIDGLKPYGNGYLISNLAGQTSCVTVSGETVPLLNTTDKKVNAADFEYIPGPGLLVIPTFFDHRIVAYELR